MTEDPKTTTKTKTTTKERQRDKNSPPGPLPLPRGNQQLLVLRERADGAKKTLFLCTNRAQSLFILVTYSPTLLSPWPI